MTLPPRPASAASARTRIERALREWGCEQALVERALAVVNELVANVIRHARTDAVVEISLGSQVVRIEVSDASTAPARIRHGGDPLQDERGLGLMLVRELSSAWGVDEHPDGKTVWAEFRAEP